VSDNGTKANESESTLQKSIPQGASSYELFAIAAQIKASETCSMQGRDQKSIHNLTSNIWKEETA
jgi:hypothetical protein